MRDKFDGSLWKDPIRPIRSYYFDMLSESLRSNLPETVESTVNILIVTDISVD